MVKKNQSAETQVRVIRNAEQARTLAHWLLVPGVRQVPVVAVSIAPRQTEPYPDPDAIQNAVGHIAEVVIIPDGDASWAFAQEMPTGTQVYNGASRVYPVDHGWVLDRNLSRLRLAVSVSDRDRVTRQLIQDVLALVYPDGVPVVIRRAANDPRDARITELEEEVERWREKHRITDTARVKAVRQVKSMADRLEQAGIDVSASFSDPQEQFRFEVFLEWARRIPASDKAARPLAAYDVGPGFLASVDDLEGVSRAKIVSVVVEVLTGLAQDIAGRELHLLRESEVGNTSAVTRGDGAVCWRVALQQDTPAARRLHFWRLGDRYELSRVAVHDDFRP